MGIFDGLFVNSQSMTDEEKQQATESKQKALASHSTRNDFESLMRAIADFSRNSDQGFAASSWSVDPGVPSYAQNSMNTYLKKGDNSDEGFNALLMLPDLYQPTEDTEQARANREQVKQWKNPFDPLASELEYKLGGLALANLDSGIVNQDTGFENSSIDPEFWAEREAMVDQARQRAAKLPIYSTPELSSSSVGDFIGSMQDDYGKATRVSDPYLEDLQNYSLEDLRKMGEPVFATGSGISSQATGMSDNESGLNDTSGAAKGGVAGNEEGEETLDGRGEILDSAGNRFKRKEATDPVSQQFLADHGDDGMSYYTNVNSDIFDAYQESVANASANGAAVIPTQYSDLWDFQMNATADEFLQWAQFANTLYGMYNEPQFLNEDGTLNADEIYRFYDQCKATSIVADQFLSPGASADLAGVLFTDYRTAQAAAAWVADMTGLNVADINTLADLLWTSHMLGDIDGNGRMIDQGADVYNNAYDLGYMGEPGTEIGDYSVYNPLASGTQYSAQGRMGDEGNAIWSSWQDLGNDRESAYAHQRNLENQLVDSNSDLNYAYLLGNLPNSQNSEEDLRQLAALAHYVRGYGYNQ